MPFYICEYVGDGTRAVPFRPALYDEAQGCSAIDIRPDASRLDGGGLNVALVWCPLDISGPKWIKLGLDKLENLSAARIQAIYSKLKITARNAGTRIDDILADLLITPPTNGWNGLKPSRGFYEIWLGPRADKLLFKMATIGGGATDAFTRADETPLASPWTRLTGSTGNLNLSSNAVTASAQGDKFYYYSGAASSGDHYSQWTNPTRVTNDDWGPAVRVGANGFSGYWFSVFATVDGQAVNKFDGGSFSLVENLPDFTPANGDIYRCEISGSTITSKRNGAEVSGSPSTDLTLTGGQPGVFNYDTGGSLDDFDGGDLGGGGLSPNVSDSVTVSESVTMNLKLMPSVNDAVTVSESITMNVILMPNVNEAVTVSESVTVNVILMPSVSDDVAVSESVTMNVILMPNVNDAVTVAESVTVSITSIGLIPINVFDSVTVSESVSVLLPYLAISVNDDVTVVESVTITIFGGVKRRNLLTMKAGF